MTTTNPTFPPTSARAGEPRFHHKLTWLIVLLAVAAAVAVAVVAVASSGSDDAPATGDRTFVTIDDNPSLMDQSIVARDHAVATDIGGTDTGVAVEETADDGDPASVSAERGSISAIDHSAE